MGDFQCLVWLAELCYVRLDYLLQSLLDCRYPGFLGDAVQREKRLLATDEIKTSGYGGHRGGIILGQ